MPCVAFFNGRTVNARVDVLGVFLGWRTSPIRACSLILMLGRSRNLKNDPGRWGYKPSTSAALRFRPETFQNWPFHRLHAGRSQTDQNNHPI
jgi:hypothetical protein